MTHRVATAAEELAMLPPHIFRAAHSSRYDFVFYVNEDSGEIDGGSLVDVDRPRFCRFIVMDDPDGDGPDVIATTDWLPLDDDS